MSSVPNGILANQFWHDASAYVQAAEILIGSETPRIQQPIYFMLSHSLELALKAYLLAKGEPESGFRVLGHDLARAHARAAELGLKVQGENTVALIERLSEFHDTHFFRYPLLTKDERRLVLRGHLIRAADILAIVKSVCAQVQGPTMFARFEAAAHGGEVRVETWHMGLPAEPDPDRGT